MGKSVLCIWKNKATDGNLIGQIGVNQHFKTKITACTCFLVYGKRQKLNLCLKLVVKKM